MPIFKEVAENECINEMHSLSKAIFFYKYCAPAEKVPDRIN